MLSAIESQEDVSDLLLIFVDIWSAEAIYDIFSLLQNATCLLVKNDVTKKVSGYAFYKQDLRSGFTEIVDMGVVSYFRGRGYGKELVREICDRSDTGVRLYVQEDNVIARRMYEVLGFAVTVTVPNYYIVGLDGLRMEWRRP